MSQPTVIVDAVSGQRIIFDEAASDEETLVWDEWREPNDDPLPLHYYREIEERFSVREGELLVEMDGATHRIGPGEEITIPPGTPRTTYTEAEPMEARCEVSPPERVREALTNWFAATHEVGGLSGVADVLQTVLLLEKYREMIVVDQPPRAIQRLLFPPLAALGRAIGLRAEYSYPTEEHEQPRVSTADGEPTRPTASDPNA